MHHFGEWPHLSLLLSPDLVHERAASTSNEAIYVVNVVWGMRAVWILDVNPHLLIQIITSVRLDNILFEWLCRPIQITGSSYSHGYNNWVFCHRNDDMPFLLSLHWLDINAQMAITPQRVAHAVLLRGIAYNLNNSHHFISFWWWLLLVLPDSKSICVGPFRFILSGCSHLNLLRVE